MISAENARKCANDRLKTDLTEAFEQIQKAANEGKFSTIMYQLNNDEQRFLEDKGYTVEFNNFNSTYVVRW